jgi:hypothetical protein
MNFAWLFPEKSFQLRPPHHQLVDTLSQMFIAQRADLIVAMMYDTAIKTTKIYRHLMSQWTIEVLNWSGDIPVLLGIPTYNDRNSGYQHPEIENIRTSLSRIPAGLNSYEILPKNSFGISLYCE